MAGYIQLFFVAVLSFEASVALGKPVVISHCGAYNFQMVWNDAGSGADRDGSYWKPVNIPPGYYYLSHVGISGNKDTDFNQCIWLIKPENEWEVRAPDALTWIYDDYKTGADRDLTLVRPRVTAPGYRCLSDLAVEGRFVPPNPAQYFDKFVCVHESLAAPGVAGSETWNDRGSGGRHDVSTWTIVAQSNGEAFPNGLFTQSGYSKPTGEMFVLDTEKVQRKSLYEPELPLTTAEVMAKFGPNIYFHPDERYLPDSAEYVFERSTYKKCIVENEGNYDSQRIDCTPDAVAAAAPQLIKEWIVIPRELYGGSLARAKTYVNRKAANRDEGYTDFMIWIFNPYNGPGYFYAHCGEIKVQQRLKESGTHQGDWEHVTIRVRHASETEGPKVIAVYLSAHQGGKWHRYEDLQTDDDGRKMVFSALYTHAFYAAPSRINYCQPFSKNLLFCTLKLDLVDDPARGHKLASSTTYEEMNPNSVVMTFKGRWGDYIHYKETVEVAGLIPAYTFKEASSGPSGPPQKGSFTEPEKDEPCC